MMCIPWVRPYRLSLTYICFLPCRCFSYKHTCTYTWKSVIHLCLWQIHTRNYWQQHSKRCLVLPTKHKHTFFIYSHSLRNQQRHSMCLHTIIVYAFRFILNSNISFHLENDSLGIDSCVLYIYSSFSVRFLLCSLVVAVAVFFYVHTILTISGLPFCVYRFVNVNINMFLVISRFVVYVRI